MDQDLDMFAKIPVCYALKGGPGMPNNNPWIIGPLSKWENSAQKYLNS